MTGYRPPRVRVGAQELPRLGDFDGKPLVYAFDPSPNDVAYGTSYFGLVESDFWPYGAVRTESGRWYAYFRSIAGRVSTGLAVMSQDEGPLRFDARSAPSHVGPVQRTADDAADLYEGESPASRFSLRAGTDHVDWREGTQLHLAGPMAGPGLQMFSAWRELDGSPAHMLHAHVGYEVHGEVFGEPASGYLGLAKSYLPYGLEWLAERTRFGPACGLCALWLAFLNVYADGSVERGMMAHGGAANSFRFASVVRRDGLELSTDLLEVDYRISPSSSFESITFHIGAGGDWVFDARPDDWLDFTGMGGDVSNEQPAGYHVTLGTLRRVGDARQPMVAVAWVEGFPEAWDRA